MTGHTLASLAAEELSGLERVYREAPLGPAPKGLWDGHFLRQLDPTGWVRALDFLMFRVPRFGIDFDRAAWWFGTPRLLAGKFTATPCVSRWREADTLHIEYHGSRLPRPVKSLLYDEIKPLDDRLCLGIGGIDAERGRGEHFFFALVRR